MGCGSSNAATAEPQKKNNKARTSTTLEYDEMMGKKIPKLLVQPTDFNNRGTTMRQNSHSDDEGTKQNDLGAKDEVHRQVKKAHKKYRGGDDADEQIYENVQRVERKLQKADIQLIERSFKKHFVFFSLSQTAIEELIKKMVYCTINKGEFVFKQGDKASCYFIIDKGQVEIIINDNQVRILKEGDYFGEIALLYNAPRSASIKTLSESGFWSLDRTTFKKSIEELMLKEYDENRKFIDQVSFFSFMTSDQRDSIAHALITTRFEPNQNIVNEGDQADSYYVIKSGQVSVSKNGKEIRKMGPKDSFGQENQINILSLKKSEQALYVSSQRGATVKAETEVRCLALGRDNLTKILGDKVQIIIFSNLMRWSFEKSEILKQLTKLQLEKIGLKAKIQNYKAGQVIIEKGQPCDKLVVVLEGVLASDRNDAIVKGSCFGDAFLRKELREQPLSHQYTMQGDGVLATITFSSLFRALGGDLETAMKKNENSHEKKISQLGERADASHIKVEDLIFIKKLGQGQFGWVYLVKHKEIKDQSFALKSVSKASIIEQNLEKHILQEKTVLEMCNFPFIMQFVRTFKDDISIYFLVEYIRGMELFDVIRVIGLLAKHDTQFYVGTMILALEYLHSKGIVYRDLKPENIMINDHDFY